MLWMNQIANLILIDEDKNTSLKFSRQLPTHTHIFTNDQQFAINKSRHNRSGYNETLKHIQVEPTN